MTSNLKAIFSAVGVAALLASPAMAKTEHHHRAVPSLTSVPANAHAYAAPYAERPLVTPYAADLPQRAYETPGPSPDFQLGGEK